jgi:hypothetical protein
MGMARGMLADGLARRNQGAGRVEGRFEFLAVSQSPRARKSRILEQMESHEIYGESALFDPHARNNPMA